MKKTVSFLVIGAVTAAAGYGLNLLMYRQFRSLFMKTRMEFPDVLITLFGGGLSIILVELLAALIISKTMPTVNCRGGLNLGAAIHGLLPWVNDIGHEVLRDIWPFHGPDMYSYLSSLPFVLFTSVGAVVCIVINEKRAGRTQLRQNSAPEGGQRYIP
ncbi:hypothetical protein [Ruminococcus sp.]|uniref:hypothetical protein n=1 Tax=Ruminococcus sp. TaxID=41978 RepID=UPI0025F2CD2A|nr:hypothetical protein [Ruminococcus sp.]MBQ8966554.1 hypothetical protein [Ruminococcus sp.]